MRNIVISMNIHFGFLFCFVDVELYLVWGGCGDSFSWENTFQIGSSKRIMGFVKVQN